MQFVAKDLASSASSQVHMNHLTPPKSQFLLLYKGDSTFPAPPASQSLSSQSLSQPQAQDMNMPPGKGTAGPTSSLPFGQLMKVSLLMTSRAYS